MKVQAYNEAAPEEKVTWVRLVQEDDGVMLRAVDAEGISIRDGELLRLSSRHLCLMKGISRRFGFRLTGNGYLKVTPWWEGEQR